MKKQKNIDFELIKKRMVHSKKLTGIAQRQSIYPFCSFDDFKKYMTWIPQDYFFTFFKESFCIEQLFQKKNAIQYYNLKFENGKWSILIKYPNATTYILMDTPFSLYPTHLFHPLTRFQITIQLENEKIIFYDNFQHFDMKSGELKFIRTFPYNQKFQYFYSVHANQAFRSDAKNGNPLFKYTLWEAFKTRPHCWGILTIQNNDRLFYSLRITEMHYQNNKIINPELNKKERKTLSNLYKKDKEYQHEIPLIFLKHLIKYQTGIIYVTEPFDHFCKIMFTYQKSSLKNIPYYSCKEISYKNNLLQSFYFISKNSSILFVKMNSILLPSFSIRTNTFRKKFPKIRQFLTKHRYPLHMARQKYISAYTECIHNDFLDLRDSLKEFFKMNLSQYKSFEDIQMRILTKTYFHDKIIPTLPYRFYDYFQPYYQYSQFNSVNNNSTLYTYKVSFFDAHIIQNYSFPNMYIKSTQTYDPGFFGFVEHKFNNKKRIWFSKAIDPLNLPKNGEIFYHHFEPVNKPFHRFINHCHYLHRVHQRKNHDTNKFVTKLTETLLNTFLKNFSDSPYPFANFITNRPIPNLNGFLVPIIDDLAIYFFQKTIPSYNNTQKNFLYSLALDYYKHFHLNTALDSFIGIHNNIVYLNKPIKDEEITKIGSKIQWELLKKENLNVS